MGQGSSAESDPSGAAAPETTVKTCYYELLGVARDATQDEYARPSFSFSFLQRQS